MSGGVDWRASLTPTGTIVKWLSVPLVLPLAVAVYYGEEPVPFLVAIGVAIVLGAGLERLGGGQVGAREALLVAILTLAVVAVVGSVPFVLGGTGSVAHPVNAMFESMSGFTTTGATTIDDVTTQDRSILMWRGLTQWLGGLGAIVLAVALLSRLSIGGMGLADVELSDTRAMPLSNRATHAARRLSTVYVGMTIAIAAGLLAIHLAGFDERMTAYNAIAHALTAISTGGFSPEPRGIEAFSPAVQWALVPAMIVGATNVVLLRAALDGDPRRLLHDAAFRFFLGSVGAFTVVVLAVLLATGGAISGGVEGTVREGVFTVVSVVTTTGYASVDYDMWPSRARLFLLVAMFVGGCAGSTASSIKPFRWLLVLRTLWRRTVAAVPAGSDRSASTHSAAAASDGTGADVEIEDVLAFVLLAFVLFLGLTAFIVLDAVRVGTSMNEFEAMGAAAATFFNVGPAFGIAGPMASYAGFPHTTKLAMVVLMGIGRLEVLTVLVVFTRSFWRG